VCLNFQQAFIEMQRKKVLYELINILRDWFVMVIDLPEMDTENFSVGRGRGGYSNSSDWLKYSFWILVRLLMPSLHMWIITCILSTCA